SVIAGADDVVAVDGHFQRAEHRVAADLCGDVLIDGRAGLNIRAFGLLRVDAAHERRRGPLMLAAAVTLIGAREVVESCEDDRPIAERLERLEGWREREAGAFAGRR